jgi:hypothetical protein
LLKKTKNRSLTVTAQKVFVFACNELQGAEGVGRREEGIFQQRLEHFQEIHQIVLFLLREADVEVLVIEFHQLAECLG